MWPHPQPRLPAHGRLPCPPVGSGALPKALHPRGGVSAVGAVPVAGTPVAGINAVTSPIVGADVSSVLGMDAVRHADQVLDVSVVMAVCRMHSAERPGTKRKLDVKGTIHRTAAIHDRLSDRRIPILFHDRRISRPIRENRPAVR